LASYYIEWSLDTHTAICGASNQVKSTNMLLMWQEIDIGIYMALFDMGNLALLSKILLCHYLGNSH